MPAELAEPSVLLDREGNLELWFEERRSDGPRVRYATGNDGIHFTAIAGVVVAGSSPSAVARKDGVDLVWQDSAGLWGARFFAGVLEPPVAIATGYGAPTHLVQSDGGRLVFARRNSDGHVVAIGDLKDSVDIEPAQLIAPPYVLSASAIDSPFVERAPQGGLLRLWLTVRAVESGPSLQFGESVPTPENDSIALLLQQGQGPFVPFPYNPVLARTESITRHPFERAPSTIVKDGVRWLYYERASLDGTTAENLRVTRSP